MPLASNFFYQSKTDPSWYLEPPPAPDLSWFVLPAPPVLRQRVPVSIETPIAWFLAIAPPPDVAWLLSGAPSRRQPVTLPSAQADPSWLLTPAVAPDLSWLGTAPSPLRFRRRWPSRAAEVAWFLPPTFTAFLPWLPQGPARVLAPLPMESRLVDARVLAATLDAAWQLDDITIAFTAHVHPMAATQSWLAAAGNAATAGNLSGQYQPIVYVVLPDLGREFTTRVGQGAGTDEGLLARLDASGVGTITRDLEELTNALRLGGASFSLPNADTLIETFGALGLTQTTVYIEVGFIGIGERYRVFTGVVDRWQATREVLQVSAVPGVLHDHRPLSITVREVAGLGGGSSAFPELPESSAGTVLPLYLGPATSVPLIPVGRNLYLSGFGVEHFSAVRDNNEVLLSHGGRPLFLAYIMTVRGHPVTVVKVQYDTEGRTISMDLNGGTGLGWNGVWPNANPPSPYDFTPRPRHNMFTHGDLEGISTLGLAGFSVGLIGATATLANFPVGSGKVHGGRTSARIRSSNTTLEGDHRYTATVSRSVFQSGSSAFHISFWYIAGTFQAAGALDTERVSSQISVKINGGPWTTLGASPSFDQMVQFSTTIVALNGVVTLQVKCEGLSAEKSADIFLDDFVCWGEDPVHPFVDQGVYPITAMLSLCATWLPGVPIDTQSFIQAGSGLVGWKIVSIIPGADDALGLLLKIASQIRCLLYKDIQGVYRLESVDAFRFSAATFSTSNIVEHSISRIATPSDSIYSSFLVQYSQNNGAVYLSPEGTSMEDATLVGECAIRAALLGGDHRLNVPSDLILDKYTATALLLYTFAAHGPRNDLIQWRSWLDALPLTMLQRVLVSHPLITLGGASVDIVGWHFLPNQMEVELVGRPLVTTIGIPAAPTLPVMTSMHTFTPAGIAVGISIPNFVTPAPDTTLDVTSVVVSAATPGGAGTFAVSNFGTVVFTPTIGFSGLVTATVTIADTNGMTSNEGQLQITVGIPMELVVANPDTATTPVNTPVTFAALTNDAVVAPGVLAPATLDLDPDTDARQVTFTDPLHGTFDADDLGNVTFTPVTDYVGDAVALYTIGDDLGNVSNPATITVTVEALYGWTLLQTILERAEEVNNTGLHVINAFTFFSGEIQRLVAVTGDPRPVGGTGAVAPPGPNDVYSSSRLLARPLGGSEEFGRTRLAGTLLTTTGGNNTTALVNAQFYGQHVYGAFNTADQADDEMNAAPVIFSIINLIDYEQDSFAATWIEEHEFAATFTRVGAMYAYDTKLYVALEPLTPGSDSLDIWTYDNTTWAFQESLGTSVSRLRSFVNFAGVLYGGADGKLYTSTGGAWTLAHTFTGLIDTLAVPVDDTILYVNVLNGTNREIWTTTNGADYVLLHTLTNETSELPGVMTIGPDGVLLYVSIREGTATRMYVYTGSTWAISRDWGTEFLGVSAVLTAPDGRLYAALARRWHAIGDVDFAPDAEIWYLAAEGGGG